MEELGIIGNFEQYLWSSLIRVKEGIFEWDSEEKTSN